MADPLPPIKVTEMDLIATPLAATDISFRTPFGTDEEEQFELDLWTQKLLQDIVNEQQYINRRWVANPTAGAPYYTSFDGMNFQVTGGASGSVAAFGPTASHPLCTEITTGNVAGQQWYAYVSTDGSCFGNPGIFYHMLSVNDVTDLRLRVGLFSTQPFNFALLPSKSPPGSWILSTSLFFELDTDRNPNLLIKAQNDTNGSGGFVEYDTGIQLDPETVYLFEFEFKDDGTVDARVNLQTVMEGSTVFALSSSRVIFPGSTITSLDPTFPARSMRSICGGWNIRYP